MNRPPFIPDHHLEHISLVAWCVCWVLCFCLLAWDPGPQGVFHCHLTHTLSVTTWAVFPAPTLCWIPHHHLEDNVVQVRSTVHMNSGMHSLYFTHLQNYQGVLALQTELGGFSDFSKECEEHRGEQGFTTLTVHCLVVLQWVLQHCLMPQG